MERSRPGLTLRPCCSHPLPLLCCHASASLPCVAASLPCDLFVARSCYAWLPLRARTGFFTGAPFYKVVPGLFVQFGLSPNVTLQREWDGRGTLADETRIEHPDWNMRGTVAFATSGEHSRATQLIINYDDNHQLDNAGFVPFGRVVSGMHVFSSVYSGYRERPQVLEIRRRGSQYLQADFPRLSYIVEAQQETELSKRTFGRDEHSAALFFPALFLPPLVVPPSDSLHCCSLLRSLRLPLQPHRAIKCTLSRPSSRNHPPASRSCRPLHG